MKYRSEIDGLRALAVLPVILFHAGFEWFSGGFVGVDVFFVISGYLITTILIEDIENKKFSIVNFYERRARRILPALFFVMLVCIPFAWMLMLPSQMKEFSLSLLAVSLFASNILFWRESGYFDTTVEEKPLLHTWSLAVEEQYYLIFPIFLFFAWRFGKNRVFWIIVILAAVSLLLSEWGWRNEPDASFYLAPSRAWELFAGSIAAFIVLKRGVQKNNFLAMFGLTAIIFSIFAYDENVPFPSVYTLVPVLGVVLLVLYGDGKTFAGKLLSIKALVGIGLISYSAYLWHQPLFAFTRLGLIEHLSFNNKLTLTILSIVLGYLSWNFIEKPFRDKSLLKRAHIFLLSSIGIAFFVTAGLIGYFNQGFPNRFESSLAASLENAQNTDLSLDGIGCALSASIPHPLPSACGVNQKNEEIEVLMIGDSHLDSIGLQLLDKFEETDTSAYAISYSGCVPISGLDRLDADNSFQCVKYNETVRHFANTHGVKTIILVARFPLYLLGERYNNGEGGIESGRPVLVDLADKFNFDKTTTYLTRIERVAERYRADIELLARDFNIVVFTPTPEVGWDVPSYYGKKMLLQSSSNDIIDVSHSYDNYRNRNIKFNEILKSIDSKNLYIYDVHKLFCNLDSGRCLANAGENLLYRDNDHLSSFGANIVAQDFIQFYENQVTAPSNE